MPKTFEPKAIIFLDLDGPMIPWSYPKGVNPFVLPEEEFPFHNRFGDKQKDYLTALCAEFDALVVTNSTHNSPRMGEKYLRALFEANGLGHLLYDNTEYSRNIFNRLEAVEQYLKANLWTGPFVIFDDDYRDFDPQLDLSEYFVRTGLYGMNKKEYTKAREILKEQSHLTGTPEA